MLDKSGEQAIQRLITSIEKKQAHASPVPLDPFDARVLRFAEDALPHLRKVAGVDK